MSCFRAVAFALGVALASVAQAESGIVRDQPLTGDIEIEIIPGGGASGTLFSLAPKFKNRDFAEGWCAGLKCALAAADHPSEDHAVGHTSFTIETEDHQTIECK